MDIGGPFNVGSEVDRFTAFMVHRFIGLTKTITMNPEPLNPMNPMNP